MVRLNRSSSGPTSHPRRITRRTWSVLLASLVTFVLFPVFLSSAFGSQATADGIITVCSAGPPLCDYQTIQAGLDATSQGDTVLVSPGVYSGTLALKDGVKLASTDGPETTILTAPEGPIVSATGILSTTIQGLTIRGSETVTPTIGFALAGSGVAIVDSFIRDFSGAAGTTASPDGADAIGIHATGGGSLSLSGVAIENLQGGEGARGIEGGAIGGDAIGIRIDGPLQVTIADSTVQRLIGGGAGTRETWPYYCEGAGGSAIGIKSQGEADVTVFRSLVSDITGGAPCTASAAYCIGRAGEATAVEATGGHVLLRDNRIERLAVAPAHEGQPVRGVYTVGSSEVRLESNSFSTLSASAAFNASTPTRPASPYCGPPPGRAIAVESAADDSLWLVDNSIVEITGFGYGGEAVGIRSLDAGQVTLYGNRLTSLEGSGPGMSAVGLWIQGAQEATVRANVLGQIQGGTVPNFGYDFGADGGDAAGIVMSGISVGIGEQTTMANNIVWSVSGGAGTTTGYYATDGGDGVAVRVAGDAGVTFANNTLFGTAGGTAGANTSGNPGQDGVAVGLDLSEGATVLAVNNALVGHGQAISVTIGSMILPDYNDFWANGADIVGALPGPHDLHVWPGFMNPSVGDFHLRWNSALVDAGTNVVASSEDFEGDSRPVDGNGDGIAVVDIGADEYLPGTQKPLFLPIIVNGMVSEGQ